MRECVCVRVRVRVCMCVRVSEAEVAGLFPSDPRAHSSECVCTGVRSCANRRILLCKQPADTRMPRASSVGEACQFQKTCRKDVQTQTMSGLVPPAYDFGMLWRVYRMSQAPRGSCAWRIRRKSHPSCPQGSERLASSLIVSIRESCKDRTERETYGEPGSLTSYDSYVDVIIEV